MVVRNTPLRTRSVPKYIGQVFARRSEKRRIRQSSQSFAPIDPNSAAHPSDSGPNRGPVREISPLRARTLSSRAGQPRPGAAGEGSSGQRERSPDRGPDRADAARVPAAPARGARPRRRPEAPAEERVGEACHLLQSSGVKTCSRRAENPPPAGFSAAARRHPNVTLLSTDLCHTPGRPWRFKGGVRSAALLWRRPCRWRRALPAALSRAAVGRSGSGQRGACVSLLRCRASSRWRGGLCGCERQVRTCPSKTKPASLEAGGLVSS